MKQDKGKRVSYDRVLKVATELRQSCNRYQKLQQSNDRVIKID